MGAPAAAGVSPALRPARSARHLAVINQVLDLAKYGYFALANCDGLEKSV